MREGAMPLAIDVFSLPLHLWEKWHGTPFRIGSDTHSHPILLEDLPLLLPWARLGNLLFLWLLIVYGWLLGNRLAGAWGGRMAAFMLAMEPSILAHATLATTDVAASASILALVYHFDSGRDQRWLKRVGAPAIWYGLAILSKASAMVFAPLCLITIELMHLAPGLRPGDNGKIPLNPPLEKGDLGSSPAPGLAADPTRQVPPPRRWRHQLQLLWVEMRPFRRDLRQIILLALAVTFVYVGSDWQVEPTFVKWADTLGDGGWGQAVQWLSRHLRIFTNAGEGLMQQIKHNVRGHGVYLLGQVHPRAVWYYFPVALSIKMTLPMLLAPLLLLAVRPKALRNCAVACGAVLLAFSFTYRVQIGIRLILPVLALLAVGLAAALAEAAGSLAGRKRRAAVGAITVGMLWMALSALLVWPHGLCYTNELWGGTSKGYLWLSDSNYDWGQGLKDLDRWRRDHGLTQIDVWHYGLDPARERPPFHSVPLQQVAVQTPQDIGALLETGYLAVGTTLLYGGWDREPLRGTTALLRSMQPVGRTMTHFIYAFPKP
jgi:hypothetical protein